MAQVLKMDTRKLLEVLQNADTEKQKTPPPLIEVLPNTDTLNVLIDRLGLDGTRQYLTDRKRYVNELQKGIQAEYDANKAAGHGNEQVRKDLEQTFLEQKEIATESR